MEQVIIGPPPDSSFGALLRAWRLRALLSQEQLAATAGLSERTVRDLEADRVRSPRTDTVRLLPDALQLSGPDRESWVAAGRGMNHQRVGPRHARGRRPHATARQRPRPAARWPGPRHGEQPSVPPLARRGSAGRDRRAVPARQRTGWPVGAGSRTGWDTGPGVGQPGRTGCRDRR